MQDRGGGMVNSLEAKAMSQPMLESGTESSFFHYVTCCSIYSTCAGTIAYTFQGGILRCYTCQVRFSPFVANRSGKEAARKFRPVAVYADLHLHRDSIPALNRIVRSQVEGAISQSSTLACHDMYMRQDMMHSLGSISCTQQDRV